MEPRRENSTEKQPDALRFSSVLAIIRFIRSQRLRLPAELIPDVATQTTQRHVTAQASSDFNGGTSRNPVNFQFPFQSDELVYQEKQNQRRVMRSSPACLIGRTKEEAQLIKICWPSAAC